MFIVIRMGRARSSYYYLCSRWYWSALPVHVGRSQYCQQWSTLSRKLQTNKDVAIVARSYDARRGSDSSWNCDGHFERCTLEALLARWIISLNAITIRQIRRGLEKKNQNAQDLLSMRTCKAYISEYICTRTKSSRVITGSSSVIIGSSSVREHIRKTYVALSFIWHGQHFISKTEPSAPTVVHVYHTCRVVLHYSRMLVQAPLVHLQCFILLFHPIYEINRANRWIEQFAVQFLEGTLSGGNPTIS